MLLSNTVFPSTGSAGDIFWVLLNNVLLLLEANDQFEQNELELTIRDFFGDGVVRGSYTPPILSIGSGLQVNIAPHTTLNGFANKLANSAVVALPPSTTKYIWELQNNTDLTPSYVLTDILPVYPLPGTVDNLPTLLGQATSNATNITSITEMFALVGVKFVASGGATAGYILTADGSGGSAFLAPAAGPGTPTLDAVTGIGSNTNHNIAPTTDGGADLGNSTHRYGGIFSEGAVFYNIGGANVAFRDSGGTSQGLIYGDSGGFLHISANGALDLTSNSDPQLHVPAVATSASAGTNGAVPAQVDGYLRFVINGTTYRIPLFH